MASAGTVQIDFAAETAKFTAELKKVRGQLTDLQKTTSAISGAFSNAGKAIAGAFAGVSVATAIGAVVRATAEAEEASARLENALKSSSAAAALSAEQLKDYASQLQRTSTFGDEAIQDVESLLLSFKGLSGDTILKATSAVLDLASRLGTDLHSAALLVGKALSDPEKGLSALTRAGVAFSKEQQTTIKRLVDTGNAAKAQSEILKELDTRFGGAAAAARNNFSGAMQAVKNAFGDLLEAKGGLPAVTASLNQMAETLQDPAVVQGADALFSTLIRGAASAGTFLTSLTGGLQVLANKGGNEVVNLDKLIDSARKQRDDIINLQGEFSEGFTASQRQELLRQVESDLAKLEAQQREMLKLGEFSEQLAPVKVSVQPITADRPDTGAGTEAFQKQLQLRQQLLTASISTMSNELDAFDAELTLRDKKYVEGHAALNENTKALLESRVQFYIDSTRREVEATLEAERQKAVAVAQYEQQKQDMQKSTIAAGVGLLQAFAVRSKGAARALIVVNRGLQIAQATQNTAAAVTNALANVPYPYNLAAAAQMQAMGAIQIGLIAATGALELSNVNSGNAGGIGGSTLGTPANPLPVRQDDETKADRAIILNLYGPVAGPDSAQWLVDQISELINGNDTVIINGNSRQASEIRGH